MSADPVAFARDLLRCPSVTPAEGGALSYLETVLAGAGFAVDRVTFSEPGADDVENLYARIGTRAASRVRRPHRRGAAGRRGAVAAWAVCRRYRRWHAVRPRRRRHEGRHRLRLAAVLDHLAANGGKPKGSISFLITGDEEGIAVNGTVKLLKWAAARGETFDHCILGEPTNPEQLGDMVKIGRRGSLNGTLVVPARRATSPIRRSPTIRCAASSPS